MWSLCRWVRSTARKAPAPDPRPAARMRTPRPQSKRKSPTEVRTRVDGPARCGSGSGEPLPRMMTCMALLGSVPGGQWDRGSLRRGRLGVAADGVEVGEDLRVHGQRALDGVDGVDGAVRRSGGARAFVLACAARSSRASPAATVVAVWWRSPAFLVGHQAKRPVDGAGCVIRRRASGNPCSSIRAASGPPTRPVRITRAEGLGSACDTNIQRAGHLCRRTAWARGT